MAKKKRPPSRPPYETGSLDELAPPNRHVSTSPGSISDLLRPDGSSAFIAEHEARGAGTTFRAGLIDPFLLEELLDADDKLRRLGVKAAEQGRWKNYMLEAARLHVQRVFEEEYIPRLLEEFEKSLEVVAEYALVRAASHPELFRLHESIRTFKPRR